MSEQERNKMVVALSMEDLPMHRLYCLSDDELVALYRSYYPVEETV